MSDALKFANALENYSEHQTDLDIAIELRRLHAENEALKMELNEARALIPRLVDIQCCTSGCQTISLKARIAELEQDAAHSAAVAECDYGLMCDECEALEESNAQLSELAKSLDKKCAEYERLLDGVPPIAIVGGWTARGLMEHAKKLENRISELEQNAARYQHLKKHYQSAIMPMTFPIDLNNIKMVAMVDDAIDFDRGAIVKKDAAIVRQGAEMKPSERKKAYEAETQNAVLQASAKLAARVVELEERNAELEATKDRLVAALDAVVLPDYYGDPGGYMYVKGFNNCLNEVKKALGRE